MTAWLSDAQQGFEGLEPLENLHKGAPCPVGITDDVLAENITSRGHCTVRTSPSLVAHCGTVGGA